MEEGIKQDGQKTVIAFVAGLLIGGLLVWVFGTSPENTDTEQPSTDTEMTDETMQDTTTDESNESDVSDASDDTNGDTTSAPQPVTGNGTLTVENQPAGGSVALANLTHPTAEGWIVVHEYDGESLGNALGASRFNTNTGLTPESVTLLRVTEAGSMYRVVFYNDNGDHTFDLNDDAPVMNASGAMIGDTFTAESAE